MESGDLKLVKCPLCGGLMPEGGNCRACGLRANASPQGSQPPSGRSVWRSQSSAAKTVVIIVLVIAAAFGGYSIWRSESQADSASQKAEESAARLDEFRAVVEPVLQQWDDASALAASTSRIALSGPVADMQRIRRDFSTLSIPYAQEFYMAYASILASMDNKIDGYLAFMAQKPDATVQEFFQASQDALNRYKAEITRLSSG